MSCSEPVASPEGPIVSGKDYAATVLAPEDAWMAGTDHEAFKEDIRALGKELHAQQGPADVAHLNKIILWSRLCMVTGFATMWYCINPVSIYLLSLGCMTRWAIVAHHICHGGFDKCSGGKYNRFKFGVGSLYRRCADWLDWMLVEAWNVEHNQLHHYHLGETQDPDSVEANLVFVRKLKAPMAVKYMAVGFFMATWKWFYYAPNTYKMLKLHEMRRRGQVPKYKNGKQMSPKRLNAPCTVADLGIFFSGVELFTRVLGPFFVRNFVLIPLAIGAVLGRDAWYNSLVSMVLAELLTNAHSFLNIVTNHTGDDLYRFDSACEPRSATFYLRQVISSANFHTGKPFTFLGDLNDFTHGWLNYQVEHHLWPDLSMLSYQKAAPLVKAICKKHNIPYIQHNVFWRLKKTVDIMVGSTSMRRFPSKFEHAVDLTSHREAAESQPLEQKISAAN